jgi:hypothetical protein
LMDNLVAVVWLAVLVGLFALMLFAPEPGHVWPPWAVRP